MFPSRVDRFRSADGGDTQSALSPQKAWIKKENLSEVYDMANRWPDSLSSAGDSGLLIYVASVLDCR